MGLHIYPRVLRTENGEVCPRKFCGQSTLDTLGCSDGFTVKNFNVKKNSLGFQTETDQGCYAQKLSSRFDRIMVEWGRGKKGKISQRIG